MINEYLSCYQAIIAERNVNLNVLKKALMYRIPMFVEKNKCPKCEKVIYDSKHDFIMDFCPFCGQAIKL